jgi:hypothetical protein
MWVFPKNQAQAAQDPTSAAPHSVRECIVFGKSHFNCMHASSRFSKNSKENLKYMVLEFRISVIP